MSAHFLVFCCMHKGDLGNPPRSFYSTFPFFIARPALSHLPETIPKGKDIKEKSLTSLLIVTQLCSKSPWTPHVSGCLMLRRQQEKSTATTQTMTPSLPSPPEASVLRPRWRHEPSRARTKMPLCGRRSWSAVMLVLCAATPLCTASPQL